MIDIECLDEVIALLRSDYPDVDHINDLVSRLEALKECKELHGDDEEEKCLHEDTYISDRMTSVCRECGEDLGR